MTILRLDCVATLRQGSTQCHVEVLDHLKVAWVTAACGQADRTLRIVIAGRPGGGRDARGLLADGGDTRGSYGCRQEALSRRGSATYPRPAGSLLMLLYPCAPPDVSPAPAGYTGMVAVRVADLASQRGEGWARTAAPR
jgi:hypothetical protein